MTITKMRPTETNKPKTRVIELNVYIEVGDDIDKMWVTRKAKEALGKQFTGDIIVTPKTTVKKVANGKRF